jgi:hypothetical protein
VKDSGSDLPAARLVPAGHPLHGLAAYLAQLQAGRAFPHPRDFDILACRRYAGWIHLIDVKDGPDRRDYVFAIHASRIVEITGRDYQGRRVSEIDDEVRRDHLYEVLDRVMTSRTPEFMRDHTRGPIRLGTSYAFDRLVWPMSANNQTIDRLLLGIHPI